MIETINVSLYAVLEKKSESRTVLSEREVGKSVTSSISDVSTYLGDSWRPFCYKTLTTNQFPAMGKGNDTHSALSQSTQEKLEYECMSVRQKSETSFLRRNPVLEESLPGKDSHG